MRPPAGAAGIAEQVIAWQAVHGRHHLPWQQSRDPYRVWLSEIMLQQTQVSTVLDYYARFLERFPTVQALALAPQDEVMGLWSGLGYYTRARNLHRCAQQVMREHGGEFPHTVALLVTLPGIGRSTAGAIAAFCFSQRVAILDANVRRVLTRVLGFDLDLASLKNERLLWDKAETLLPHHDLASAMPRYTQGLMDLGASVCTPKRPQCAKCPLSDSCVALQQGTPEQYPVKTRKLRRSTESWQLLVMKNSSGQVWLQRRASTGIWAGLHCVPAFADLESLDAFLHAVTDPAQVDRHDLTAFVHVLTHRDLYLHPVMVEGMSSQPVNDAGEWMGPAQWNAVGLPAPIRKLLETPQRSLC